MHLRLLFFLACLFVCVYTSFAQTGWVNLGPDGGEYDAMAIDYKNPPVMYVGTRPGQIYKTTNEGQSWTFLTNLFGNITKIVVDSSNSGRIFVGTAGGKIYYSTDGGTTWSPSSTVIGTTSVGFVNDIQINPLNPTQLFAFDNTTLYKSVNGGQSWQNLSNRGDSTSPFTAFAFDPQDPLGRMYSGVGGQIQASSDGGYNFVPKPFVPLQPFGPSSRICKIYVEQNPSATIHVLQADIDSTRILRSTDGGNNWTITYRSNKNFLGGLLTSNYFSWQQRTASSAEHMVALPLLGILKTNDGGSSWYMLQTSQPHDLDQIRSGSFVRSSADTGRFYACYAKNATKMKITSSGSVSLTTITAGLNANEIAKIHFSNGPFIVAQTGSQDLIASLNYGSDYTTLTGIGQNNTVKSFEYYQGPDASDNKDDTARYVLQNGKIFKTDSMSPIDSVDFPVGMNFVQDLVSYHYNYTGPIVSSIGMVGAVSGPSNGAVIVSMNFGNSWQTLPSVPFVGHKAKHVAAYYDDTHHFVRIFAATDDSVYYYAYGQSSTWKAVYAGSQIQHIAVDRRLDQGNSLLVSEQNNQLKFVSVDLALQQYSIQDVTQSLASLIPFGGQIVDLTAGEDGFYMILDVFGGASIRRIYKSGFSNNITWAEITEPPVDQLRVNNVVTLRDQSNNVVAYAAANNGIWKLTQTAILSYDTIVASAPTSLPGDSSVFLVNFTNSGTANLDLDTVAIVSDPQSNFKINSTQSHYVIQLKSTLAIPIRFKPQSLSSPQATLMVLYRVARAVKGPGLPSDSAVVLSTRLVGIPKASRISANLKGDTLSFDGALLQSTKSKTFVLTNSGTDVLHISSMQLQSGSNFTLADVNGTDTTQVDVLPGQAASITVTFSPDSNKSYTDRLLIHSSAYNFLSNIPDTLHTITIGGTGSSLLLTGGTVSAQLDEDVTINLELSQIKASEASGFIQYRALGTGASGYKQRSLTPVTGAGGNLRLEATIPAEDVTSDGLEFYAEVTSGSTTQQFPDRGEFNPYGINVGINSPGLNSSGILTLPGGTSSKAYRLVSFPIALTDKTPTGAFAASNLGELGDKNKWQLYRYNNATQKFLKASDDNTAFGTIESGNCYLVISRDEKILNSGSGQTVTKLEARTSIEPGWNMISDPYTFSLNWVDVAKVNSGVDYTKIVVLENGKFHYVDEDQLPALKLEPWKGYMYNSDSNFTLIYPPLDATRSSGTSKASARSHAAGEYSVRLALQSNDEVEFHRLGELESASQGKDKFDKPVLPSMDPTDVQLRFVNEKNYWHSEFKPISQNGSYWDFEITTGAKNAHAVLHWEDLSQLPQNFDAVLIDRDRNTVSRLTAVDHMDVTVGNKEKRSFRIIVGTDSYISENQSAMLPTSFSLAANYPNPFNPTTTIRYGLPENSRVELIVYNLLGQKVRTLIRETQNAAFHSILWDGRNDLGASIASGVYFYRLTTHGLLSNKEFVQTRKMLLIK